LGSLGMRVVFQDLAQMVCNGGAKDVYIPHGSTCAVGAGVSGITTETTAPPLLTFVG
jgi:hypothetical protein